MEKLTLLQQTQIHQSKLQHHPIPLETVKRGNVIIRKLIQREPKMVQANKRLTWLTTRSVTPVLSCPLFGAIESNSSKNRRHGAALAALEKISRTWNQHICISSRTIHHTSLVKSITTNAQKINQKMYRFIIYALLYAYYLFVH